MTPTKNTVPGAATHPTHDYAAPPLDLSPLMSGLFAILQQTDFAWALGLAGEDQASKLTMLTGDLRRPPSANGDGKRICSGFAYLATASAISWANACRDHLYPVMRQSIESFDGRWSSIRSGLADRPYQYVSLGPGDGQKDSVILPDLGRENPDLCYVPVDMSPEMLRLAGQTVVRGAKLSRGRILPMQLDFSVPGNLAELRRLLDGLFGAQPVLFSLLGNTLANFDHDTALLRTLAAELLRPQDRLVLEVATVRRLDPALAQEAGAEYERSRAFREFVTSALMHYTDLHVDMDSVLVRGSVEGERGVLVKVLYQNRTEAGIRVTLVDRTEMSFEPGDTIRLAIIRKYLRDTGVCALLADAGVRKVDGTRSDLTGADGGRQFGMDLAVLAPGGPNASPERTVARDIWRR